MTLENSLSSTEKHNAMISYCFLAPLMLISRQESFRSEFVRAHAKYASVLSLCFFVLLIFLVRSQSFSSLLLFDTLNFVATWEHITLFILFFVLLIVTLGGILRALRGLQPHMRISLFSTQGMHMAPEGQTLEEKEKIPTILSHVPFLGIYLAYKYNGHLHSGAKLGSWAFLIAGVCAWLDPDFFLLISWIIISTLWIVYQSVKIFSDSSIHLLGEKLPGAVDIHIILRTAMIYFRKLVNHDNILPIWSELLQGEKSNYKESQEIVISPVKSFPFLNIFGFIASWRSKQITRSSIQGIMLTVGISVGILAGNAGLIMVLLLASFYGFTQIHFSKRLDIPVISECALICMRIIDWSKKKSIMQQESHISK